MNAYSQPCESGAKKFWRVVFGTMVGFILSSIVLTILSMIFFGVIIAALSGSTPTVKENSVLKLSLSEEIHERAMDNPFSDLNLGQYSQTMLGLDDILSCLESAASDPKIEGVALYLSHVNAAPATREEIRNAIVEFKQSGKFVYAYGESFTQGAYYIASAADKIFLNKMGAVEFKGVAFQVMFYKGLLDKLDLEVQIVRHGQFKSAVEPFMLDKMSEANRTQMGKLATTIWETMAEQISEARGISIDSLNFYADNLLPQNATEALNFGFVDALVYENEFEDTLRSKLHIDEDDDINFVTIANYKAAQPAIEEEPDLDKIAVFYAVGSIIDGNGDDETIGSRTFCRDFRKVYQDDNVKAIVLRINSPGGSALASEVIWNEIEQAKHAGKVIVVSMGDYAASGGYYMACNADAIVAEPNTLTGSIGVFGMIPNAQNLLKNKLGITIDGVNSNAHSSFYSAYQPLDPLETQRLQNSVEEVYATFTKRVAEGRTAAGVPMSVEQVDKIGQGRVWAGKDALEIGLVDQLGHIDDAVALAAEMAKLSFYERKNYPEQQDWLTKLLNSSTEVAARAIKAEMGELYYTYSAVQTVLNARGVQARMPMDLLID